MMSRGDLLAMDEVKKELNIKEDAEAINDAVETYRNKKRDIQRAAFSSMRGGDNGGRRRRGRPGQGDPNAETPTAQDQEQEQREQSREDRMKEFQKLREKAAKDVAKLDKETDEILALLLEDNQWKRLGEIQFQSGLRRGVLTAMLDKTMAAKVKVTKDQAKKLEEVKKAADEQAAKEREAMMKRFQDFRNMSEEERGELDFQKIMADARKKAEDTRKALDKKAMAVLTDGQRKSIETMKGKEFKFPERQRGGARGQGRRGQRPGGNRPERPGAAQRPAA